MSAMDLDVDRLLEETAEDLFRRHSTADVRRAAAGGGWAPGLWAVANSAELPLLGVPEQRGGAGGTPTQWAAVIRAAGRHGAPIPLVETSLAGWLLAATGRTVSREPLTVAEACIEAGRGFARGVPYARHATAVVVLVAQRGRLRVGAVAREAIESVPGTNVAGEPRDEITFAADAIDHLTPTAAGMRERFRCRATLGRALQIAGALEAIQQLTVRHVREREQFGVPLARLPVVRQHLAIIAEEVAVARAATDVAVNGLDKPDAELGVAVAKVRTGEAAGRVARLAHQLHGAIGTTEEHVLQHLTKRVWSWRDEEGDERRWAVTLGRAVITGGGGELLWPLVTGIGSGVTGAVR